MREPPIEISVGFRVGKLEVKALRTKGRVPSESVWECRCDCGAPVMRTTRQLRQSKQLVRNSACPKCVRKTTEAWSSGRAFQVGGM